MQSNHQYDIRSRIIRRVYEQCLKLLGPDDNQYPTNENYLKQWNTEFRVQAPPHNPVDYEVTDLDNLPTDYPLSKEEILVLDKHVSDGLDSRRLQYVQCGSKDWTSVRDRGLIPCIFIENAMDGFATDDPFERNTQAGEIVPINIRLVTMQAPDSELRFHNSTPVIVAKMRGALDYVLDGFYFEGLSERGKRRRGYTNPSQVFDSMIVSSQNLEGQISPFEVVDYRLEVTMARDKRISGDPNNTLLSD